MNELSMMLDNFASGDFVEGKDFPITEYVFPLDCILPRFTSEGIDVIIRYLYLPATEYDALLYEPLIIGIFKVRDVPFLVFFNEDKTIKFQISLNVRAMPGLMVDHWIDEGGNTIRFLLVEGESGELCDTRSFRLKRMPVVRKMLKSQLMMVRSDVEWVINRTKINVAIDEMIANSECYEIIDAPEESHIL